MDVRTRYLIVTIISWVLLGLVVYVQTGFDIVPSPLGVLSTLCLAIISALLLLVTWFCPKKNGQFFYGGLLILFSFSGLAVAIRQVYLNNYLPNAKFCFTSKEAIWPTMTSAPLVQFLNQTWQYGANCARGYAELFGFSLNPIFIFIYLLLIVLVVWQLTHVSRFGAHGRVGQGIIY